MKKEVRVRAYVQETNRGWVVKCTDGSHTMPLDKEDAQRHADYINNEDADNPSYMLVDVYDEQEEAIKEAERRRYVETSEQIWERREREARERKEKKEAMEAANRKSQKADDKYVFVVSCTLRGESGVVYLQGETNLTKITNKYGGGFVTAKEKKAKIFKSKACAQKFIDIISKCWMVDYLIRDMKVVRKSKDKIL